MAVWWLPTSASGLSGVALSASLSRVREGETIVHLLPMVSPASHAALGRCLRLAHAEGAVVLGVTGVRSRQQPGRAARALAVAAGRQLRHPPPPVPDADPAACLAALWARLRRIVITRTVVLAIEEWQWIDAPSRLSLSEALHAGEVPSLLALVAARASDHRALGRGKGSQQASPGAGRDGPPSIRPRYGACSR
jgi:hypothetical protein